MPALVIFITYKKKYPSIIEGNIKTDDQQKK